MGLYLPFTDLKEIEPFLSDDNPFVGRPWVLPKLLNDPDVVFMKATPSYDDLKKKTDFLGPEGLVLRQIALELGIRAAFISAIPYIPDGRLKAADAMTFAPYASELLRRMGAKRVVLFGADSVRMLPEFSHPFRRLDELYHRTIECGGYRFRVFPHPAILARDPTQFEVVKSGVRDLVFPETRQKAVEAPATSYMVHTTRETAEKALRALGDVVACDIETTGLDMFNDRILTIQLSWQEGTGHAFKWDLFEPHEWAAYLGPKKLIFQNGSFDVRVLAVNGVKVQVHEDTMLMHSLIDETVGTHSMEQMAQRYLGIEKWSDMVNYDSMEDNDIQTLGEYGARDTDITLRLANQFRGKVENRRIHRVLTDAYNAVIESSVFGVKVDVPKALQFQTEIEKALHDRQAYMADVYGLENPNSPQQVAKLVYEEWGLPPQKLQGRVTTNEAALQSLADEFDVAGVHDILEYRALTKTNGTYIKNILRHSEHSGRYHADFKMAATETGRLTEPLLLLIPRPSGRDTRNLGRQYQYRLRELFIPDDGHVMIGADYSGLEVGMAAHISGDARLIRDVRNRVDIHSVVAIQAFNLDVPLEPYETLKARVEEFYTPERDKAKAGVFAWLYGGDAGTIARNLGIAREEAENIINALRELYSGVAAWHELMHAEVRETGRVATPWGRYRHFNFNPSFSREVIAAQLRESTNMPIQGMATDMNLLAFTNVRRRGVRTLFPFHDAIYAQAREDMADRVAKIIKDEMEAALPGPVPFRADVNIGMNWGEL